MDFNFKRPYNSRKRFDSPPVSVPLNSAEPAKLASIMRDAYGSLNAW